MAFTAALAALTGASDSWGQSQTQFFTFSTPLPSVLPDGTTNLSGVEITNNTNNTLFFDDNYALVAPAGAPGGVLSGGAMWADPLEGRVVVIGEEAQLDNDFPPELIFDFSGGLLPVQSLAFDFAWTQFDQSTPVGDLSSTLSLIAEDSDGFSASADYFLDDEFFGGFPGTMGHIEVHKEDFFDEPLLDIARLTFDLIPIGANTIPSNKQFAIDNLRIDRGDEVTNDSDLVLLDDNGVPAAGRVLESNWLRGVTTPSERFDVQNVGPEQTTYNFTVGDPFSQATGVGVPGNPGIGFTINGNQTLTDGAIAVFPINASTTLDSGTYESPLILNNLQNSEDPGEVAIVRVNYYDPALVIANTDETIDPESDGAISVAAAGPGNPDGLRAGVRMFGFEFSQPGYQLDGFFNGVSQNFIASEEEETATVLFDPAGLVAGSYDGTLTIPITNSLSGVNGGLITGVGERELPDLVWNLTADVATKSTAEESVAVGVNFADVPLFVADASTAAALIGGSSSQLQTVELMFVENPEEGKGNPTAEIVGSVVELDFGEPGDLFVLQLTYDGTGLSEAAQSALQVLFFDPAAEAWVPAISENSDGGANGEFFAGSFLEYLQSAGGGALDAADLSDYGVDTSRHQIWAVLDHNSLFGVGVPEPTSLGLLALACLSLSLLRIRTSGQVCSPRSGSS